MSEVLLRMHVWLVVTALPLLVRLVDLPRLLKLATPRRPWRVYRGLSSETIGRAVARRLRRSRHMKRRACLRRGLALYHFLRLAGRPAVLRVGAWPPGRDPERLHAHCWVTVNGCVVDDDADLPPGVLLCYPGSDD
ncbi:MAG: lasso peptide biosynthesis B2 protein [Planctomycetota bacterium]